MNTDELYRYWRALKSFFEFSGRLSPTTLHIVLGLGGFIAIYIIFGRSTRSAIFAWIIIFLTQFANECVDIFFSVSRYGDINVRGTLKDFIATLLVPSLVFLLICRKSIRPFLSKIQHKFKNRSQ